MQLPVSAQQEAGHFCAGLLSFLNRLVTFQLRGKLQEAHVPCLGQAYDDTRHGTFLAGLHQRVSSDKVTVKRMMQTVSRLKNIVNLL